MRIQKRDLSFQDFHPVKIEKAIEKAFLSQNQELDQEVLVNVLKKIQNYYEPELEVLSSKKPDLSVEMTQDLIERELFTRGHFEVMKAFMTYRHERARLREGTLINCSDTVSEYIDKSDWRIAANANTGYSNAGLINNLSGKVIANFWLDSVYSKEEGLAHRNGDYHIHDLDCLSGYCAGWSLRALLNEGFNGVRGRVSSKAPSHFREALGQMANFLGILQSEWAGAQAFSSFDTYLAPYLFRDELSDAELRRALTSFVYNLNVPSRWGQSPFTNVTLDITVPDDLKAQIPTRNDLHLFRGLDDERMLKKARARGKASLEELTYSDFKPEMDRICIAFYEVLSAGDIHGSPFTFPIPTINITQDFDWDAPVADAIFENSAKMGSSYFQNFLGSQFKLDENGKRVEDEEAYKPNAVRSMCCRLQLDLRELLKRGGGLFGSAEMTGSMGVVTINLARLGYLYKNDESALYKRLDELLLLAKSTLEKKRKTVQELYDRGLYPYTARYLKHFNNHFSTIGVNGANEMIRNFTDDACDITSPFGKDFAARLLDHIRARMREFQEQSGNLYNLEATPAEGTTYRFAKEDKKRYPKIIQAGFGENIYYTNSTQVPASFSSDPFAALLAQDSLQTKYTGGTVLHLYMKERLSGAAAAKALIRRSLEQFRLPYITLTPVFSVCEKHGYLAGEHEFCPRCDEEILDDLAKEIA